MKIAKKIISLLLVAVFCLSLMVLTGCNEEVTYTVTLKDALGNPYESGVVVQFMNGSKQAGMQTCDENGVAKKALKSGKYTVALKFASEDVEYHYDEVTLTAANPDAEIVLSYKASKSMDLFAGDGQYTAYDVVAGCTYVELKEGRNYFLYSPVQAGNYEFSVVGGNNVQLGYYGMPSFVQENSACEVVDNKFTQNIKADMINSSSVGGTITLVIGIDAEKDDNCVLAINRLGDPIKTIEDEPWVKYEQKSKPSAYTLPAGAEIKEIDLTASTDTYNLVYNEGDGFYHLDSEDGPLMLVYLTENCQYIDCFESIVDRTGIRRYYFDENGEFESKVDFTECVIEYIDCADEEAGVYPLTEDLKHIITEYGSYNQWWDPESPNFRFKDMDGNSLNDINTEIAWMLMCCYIE